MSLGKAIRTLREARGWSGAELARRAQIDQPTVNRIENAAARSSPSLRNVAKIAGALGVTIESLMDAAAVDLIVDRLDIMERRIDSIEQTLRRRKP